MNDQDHDQELVRRIAEQVIRSLGSQAQQPGSETRARVRPPAGVCTGDYSKFVELRGRDIGAQPAGDPGSDRGPSPSGAPATPPVVHLGGIVTAHQLQEAIASSSDGVAVLAADARLTPLANDLVRQDPQCVRRADTDPGVRAAGAAPWTWWIDGACPAVDSVVARWGQRLVPATAPRRAAALPQVVRDLAAALKAHRVVGGFLFVPNAATSMCFANRCMSIRGVVGTCGEAVEQGIAELGANVLVIEYPHHGHRSIEAMVERMLQQVPKAPPTVQRELADLHRCG